MPPKTYVWYDKHGLRHGSLTPRANEPREPRKIKPIGGAVKPVGPTKGQSVAGKVQMYIKKGTAKKA